MAKVWPTKPSNDDVVAHIRAFFDTLRAGKLDEAEVMIAHAYDDWNENVYSLFQDHYLIHDTPPDSSFEGNWWKSNRAWLADFSLPDSPQWVGKAKNVAWFDIAYRGERSGYIGEFQVVDTGGGFTVQHNAFRMA